MTHRRKKPDSASVAAAFPWRLTMAAVAAVAACYLTVAAVAAFGLWALAWAAWHPGPLEGGWVSPDRLAALLVACLAFRAIGGLLLPARTQANRMKLTAAQCPALFEAMEEAARAAGEPPVEAVFLTPEWQVAVRLEGPFWRPSACRRVLMVGMGCLVSITEAQFRAVLAHEYAHFRPADLPLTWWAHAGLVGRLERFLAGSTNLQFLNPFMWLSGLPLRPLGAALSARRQALEYHADGLAASRVGHEAYAQGLAAVMLERCLWRQYLLPLTAATMPPGADLYAEASARRWPWGAAHLAVCRRELQELLATDTDPAETHPSLGDRLRHLGVDPAKATLPPIPRPVRSGQIPVRWSPDTVTAMLSAQSSAAEAFLGARAADLQHALTPGLLTTVNSRRGCRRSILVLPQPAGSGSAPAD